MCPVPTWLFALYIKTQRVAGIQELWVGRIVTQTDGIHIHRLDEQHVLYVLLLRQRATRLWAERVTIGTLEDDFLAIDEHTVFLVAIIGVAVFDGAETKLLALYMQRLALSVFQRKDSRIEVRLLSIPKLGVLHCKVHLGTIAGNGEGWAGSNLLSIGVDNIDAHRTVGQGAVQEDISHELPVTLGIDSHTLNVLSWFADDEHWAPDATEVPVVGPALSQVHLRIGALFQHFHLQAVLLVAEKDTVADINGVTRETALVSAIASLTSVDGSTHLRKHGLEDQQNLPALPSLGQRELMLVLAHLVGNTLWGGLAVEAHAILVSAEALQLPARGHTYLRPLATVMSIGTHEIPLYHIITTMTTQVLSLSFHRRLSHQRQRTRQRSQKKNPSHRIAIHYLF